MARQVLPIVGMVVGNIIAPGIGGMIGGMLGGLLGNAIDPMVVKGPKLGEAGLQTSAEGVYRPIVYGTGPVKGNIIERGNRQIRIHRQKQGKGGGPTTETERVSWTFAIRICEGPIGGILRIWEDEKLVYDVTPESTIPQESAAFAESFTLYLGGEDQLPDPALEAYKGVGNVNAYRGSAYAVFPNYDLTDRGERIPDYRWEVAAISDSEPQVWDMLALRFAIVGGRSIIRSSDGQDWSAEPIIQSLPFRRLYGMPGGRYIAATTTDLYYSDDYGQTFNEASKNTSWGSNELSILSSTYWQGQHVLSKLYDGIVYSSDRGNSYSVVYNGHPSQGVVAINSLLISYSNISNPRIRIAPAVFGPWSNGGTIDPGFNITSSASDGVIVRLAGNLASEPWLIQTSDGINFSTSPLPSSSGTTITAVHYDPLLELWVAATDDGELLYDNGGGFQHADDSFDSGQEVYSISSNGSQIVAGATNSGETGGQIKVSSDGISWEDAPFFPGSNTNGIQSIAGVPNDDLPEQIGLPVQLSHIVSDIHQRATQPSSYYDVSSLTDMVDGIVFAGDYSCADAIRSTMPIYTYDASEYDSGAGYRINYVKRGAPVQTTITINDLTDAPEFLAREDALERPRVLHMHYESPSVGYAAAKASPRRFSPDVKVVGEISAQVPVCFSDQDEAWQKADILLKQAWTEVAGEQDFAWPEHLIQLVPSDCVGVSLRGQVRRMRIQSVEYSGGQFQAKLIADRQSAYTSNITGIPLPPPTPPLPSIVGPTVFEFLDIPALNDSNDRLLYYTAATGQTDAWYGAAIQRKAPADTEWQDAGTYNRADYTVMGVTLNAIPASSEDYTDTTNSLTIQLYRDDVIPQLTQQQLLSEGGSFALEKPDGTWELMQYRDATQDSDGNWEISYFLRGRLNSGSSSHNAGATIVFLDYVKSVDAQTAWLDQDLTHRAVSFGTSPDVANEVVDEYTGLSQTEFPVAHLFLDRAGDTIRASCVPRHRFGTEDRPVRSVNWTGYRWTATDGSNTESQDTTTEAANFDVTGWASPVTVTVSQINRITGPGPIVSESIA